MSWNCYSSTRQIPLIGLLINSILLAVLRIVRFWQDLFCSSLHGLIKGHCTVTKFHQFKQSPVHVIWSIFRATVPSATKHFWSLFFGLLPPNKQKTTAYVTSFMWISCFCYSSETTPGSRRKFCIMLSLNLSLYSSSQKILSDNFFCDKMVLSGSITSLSNVKCSIQILFTYAN